MRILKDATVRPELFQWQGAVPKERLASWLTARNLEIPSDLAELWQMTGGGEVFETESILAPLGDPALGDDVDSVNRDLHAHGLPERFLVFHVGRCVSAVDLAAQRYMSFSIELRDPRSYPSLEDWYAAEIRSEFERRYLLPE